MASGPLLAHQLHSAEMPPQQLTADPFKHTALAPPPPHPPLLHAPRSLATAWRQLHSLHISYTALPATAELVLDAFGDMPALEHLSLYASPDAALDQHNTGKVHAELSGVWGDARGGGLMVRRMPPLSI